MKRIVHGWFNWGVDKYIEHEFVVRAVCLLKKDECIHQINMWGEGFKSNGNLSASIPLINEADLKEK